MKKSVENSTLEEHIQTHIGMHKDAIKSSFMASREYVLAKDQYSATQKDNYRSLALVIRERIAQRWIKTQQQYHRDNVKRVYYLSLEFLIGRLMGNYMYNLGMEDDIASAMRELGFDLDQLREEEEDAGLGNGGLGRLAACFLDSMATLGIPAHGYGIRYDYGIFKQQVHDGHQIEVPDEWLRYGNPWEFEREEYSVPIHFYGRAEHTTDDSGKPIVKWVDTENVLAVPFDMPIPGYKNDVVNTLRLWSARSTEEFDLKYFNKGEYDQAVYDKIQSEVISKILYPNDNTQEGKELRLKQEYFFTAAAIADIIRRYLRENDDLTRLHEKACIQLNDTHPALAVAELMRVLVDEQGVYWDDAWVTTQKTFAYTNHTLMPEALEKWPADLFGNLLPRHLEIIYEINARFLKIIKEKFPHDHQRIRRMSLIEEGQTKMVRMANLAIVGSFSVNGVSALHTDLIKEFMFKDFYELWPERFNNKTNGITQRRWLLKSNPLLSDVINEKIGDSWVTQLESLDKLRALATDTGFQEQWRRIKQENKKTLARYLEKTQGVIINPETMFDVQVKRIHEYKRQLMFALYVASQYLTIKNNPSAFHQPRTFMIGGKAAPGYFMAKLIIKLINSIATTIDQDPAVRDKIKLVFMENYRVSLAERVFPATDLSEQISTAGMEASGTGNMKFMLNGALTIGTLDGANVEMHELLGDDNIFIFGLKTHEVQQLREQGYNPQDYIQQSPMLKEIFALIENGFFCRDQKEIFHPLLDTIYNGDYYMVCADFDSYCARQQEVDALYQQQQEWTKRSIINTAKSGKFSSDRTIAQYAQEIWKV